MKNVVGLIDTVSAYAIIAVACIVIGAVVMVVAYMLLTIVAFVIDVLRYVW